MFSVQIQLMYLYASLMFRGLLHVFRCRWNAVNWCAFIYLICETVRRKVGTCEKQQICNCWLSLLKEGCLCLYQLCCFVYVLEFSLHAYISFTSVRTKKIKSGKSPGVCGVYPEYLHYAGPEAMRLLVELFAQVCESEMSWRLAPGHYCAYL